MDYACCYILLVSIYEYIVYLRAKAPEWINWQISKMRNDENKTYEAIMNNMQFDVWIKTADSHDF